eukprot:gb/GEZN01001482.1/.p1 GENE.gb/GEZN01001482.1/~~gb/GEZN01001482.1/.p1  ORF type:complete len:719 (-),score=75.90 gb/GEZN01001482.1/:430-2586(-)
MFILLLAFVLSALTMQLVSTRKLMVFRRMLPISLFASRGVNDNVDGDVADIDFEEESASSTGRVRRRYYDDSDFFPSSNLPPPVYPTSFATPPPPRSRFFSTPLNALTFPPRRSPPRPFSSIATTTADTSSLAKENKQQSSTSSLFSLSSASSSSSSATASTSASSPFPVFNTLPSPFTQTTPRYANPHFNDESCKGNGNYYGYYPGYPGCAVEVNLTLDVWKNAPSNDPARVRLQQLGVDGTYCSILDYLYAMKKVCPASWQTPNNAPRIFGVNLGGWLLIEPWITPSLFKQFPQTEMIQPLDEWHFCSDLGIEEATKQLTKHWDTWVTEDDIKALSEAGINHVRIPVGYWILDDIAPGEPWVSGGFTYLQRAIGWCKKYNIAVLVDLHSAPGSQNGYDNSGELEKLLPGTMPHWASDRAPAPNGTFSFPLIDRTLRVIEQLIQKFQYEPTVVAFELLNEISILIPAEVVKDFYIKGYKIIRKYRPDVAVVIGVTVYGECEKPGQPGCWSTGAKPNPWPWADPKDFFLPNEFTNVWMDAHIYHIFSRGEMMLSPVAHLQFPCSKNLPQLAQSLYPTIVGEWSLATTDCSFWLNGYRQGARYEGQYDGDWWLGSCLGRNDINNKTVWTKEYRDFLLAYAENQMSAYEPQENAGSQGWFFWNFKTENGGDPQWDYLLGVKEGYLPDKQELNTGQPGGEGRTYTCNHEIPNDVTGAPLPS